LARPTDSNEQLLCSFCGKSQRQVKKLIAGPGVYICDECIDLCNEIIDEELTAPAQLDLENLPKPKDIYDVLNDYVVSQEEAKRTLSVAVYNHYKRVQMVTEDGEVELQKSNILLLGPTGCGKTLLAQTLARILNVPFAIADATALTEAGYVGEDVENILLKLIQAADFDIKKAETGIIYIDEVDKIARKADNPSITRDVSGEGVQQALLKILEGTVASVPPQGGRKHPHQEFLSIDTTNILFICGGAFADLDKIARKSENPSITRDVSGEGVQQALLKIIEGTIANVPPKGGRKHPQQEFLQVDTSNILFICGGAFYGIENLVKRRTGEKGLGFGATVSSKDNRGVGELLALVEPEDLIKFGMIPEFVGRLPMLATLDDLTEDDLVTILTQPKNALVKQYQKLFEMERVKLSFTKEALRSIAHEAMRRKAGARGLRAIMENAMLDIQYDVPYRDSIKECKITEGVIMRGEEPTLLFEKDRKTA